MPPPLVSLSLHRHSSPSRAGTRLAITYPDMPVHDLGSLAMSRHSLPRPVVPGHATGSRALPSLGETRLARTGLDATGPDSTQPESPCHWETRLSTPVLSTSDTALARIDSVGYAMLAAMRFLRSFPFGWFSA